MARRTLILTEAQRQELLQLRDHDARPYVRERGAALLKIADGHSPHRVARHGLLKPSFIPPIEIRELRELTRYRQSLIRQQATVANRIQKIAESGNIKLSQVASDALGASRRRMLRALASGETDTEKMSQMARRALVTLPRG